MLNVNFCAISCRKLLHNNPVVFSRYSKQALVRRTKEIALHGKKQRLDHEIYGSRRIRPLSDIAKAFGFTVAVSLTIFLLLIFIQTGFTAYTVAILLEKNEPKLSLQERFSRLRTNDNSSNMSANEKNILAFFAMNTAVFLAWRINSILPFMTRYFTNSVASKALYLSMILSAFSHRDLIHFGMNMYVASTFLPAILTNVTSPSHFWAFYVTASAFSSFISLLEKAAKRTPIRSLGAVIFIYDHHKEFVQSGALMALLSYLCLKFPNMQLQIVFVPGFSFNAEHAFYAMVAFDAVCLLLRFKMFDHAAHLGGQLFGFIYAKFGEKLFWDDYSKVVEKLKNSSW